MLDFIAAELLLPIWSTLLFVGLFGAIIGSFLNVYIYRFHTGKSLSGRSHCLSCATPLTWYELLPVVSYLALRGKCRSCGSRITPRYAIVETLTAGLFVVAASVASGLPEFLLLSAVFVILVIITVYDYYHFIIPDELTVALTVVMVVWLGWQWSAGVAPTTLIWTIGASVVGATFFFTLWAVSRGRWLGFGDVKLAIPLGLWVGSSLVFSFIVWSFWIGAIVSVAILAWQRYERGQRSLHLSEQTLTMKSAVPFAPFMIAGATLVYVTNLNVLDLFSFTWF